MQEDEETSLRSYSMMVEGYDPESRPKPKYGSLSSKDYLSMGLGPGSQAITFYPDEGPEVFFRGKPSTTTRLHEMFHATSIEEHETPEGLAYEELQAVDFSKPGKTTLSYHSILNVVGAMIGQGYKPAKILSSISRSLEKMGYLLDRKTRSDLWWDIRDIYDSEKRR